MNDIVIAVSPSIDLVQGQPMVSSLSIAQHFRKSHKHVLRDINLLDCSEGFSRSNFGPSDYVDGRGKAQPIVRMTRNGFLFLVMGYTGAAAARIKEAYIQRFDELEARTRLPEAEVGYFKRCERELIRVQRQCITMQRRVIRLQNKLLFTPVQPPAATAQGDLFAGAAA